MRKRRASAKRAAGAEAAWREVAWDEVVEPLGRVRRDAIGAGLLTAVGHIQVTKGWVPYAHTYGLSESASNTTEVDATAGQTAAPAAATRESLSAFVKRHMSGRLEGGAYPPYVFDGSVLQRHADTLGFPRPLPAGGLSLNRTLGDRSEGGWSVGKVAVAQAGEAGDYDSLLQQLIVGPPLSGAMPHFHGRAVNGLLSGVKLWFAFPPTCSPFTMAHAMQWLEGGADAADDLHPTASCPPGTPSFRFLQFPGDVVDVPRSWSHAVINLANSVAVAHEQAA